jgi:hypothetical protein
MMTKEQIQSRFERSWLAVMLTVMGFALREVARVVASGEFNATIAVSAFVFFASWFRFYFGNFSYFDDTYSTERRNCSELAFRSKMDVILFVLHMAAFVLMSMTITRPGDFVTSVIFLNLTDCWWLVYEPRCWPPTVHVAWLVLRGRSLRSARVLAAKPYNPRLWTWNNLACAVVVLVLRRTLLMPEDCALLFAAAAAASLVTGAIDLLLTRPIVRSAR